LNSIQHGRCFFPCKVDERQFNGKFAAPPQLAGDVDIPAVRAGEVFDDGQPKTRAAYFTRSGFVHTVKPLENARQMLGGNPCARVANAKHLTTVLFSIFGCDQHAAARKVEFNRVIHQVNQNLFQPPPVGSDAKIFGDLILQLDALFSGARSQASKNIVNNLPQWQTLRH
jgi:hypothetical protein